MSLGKDPPEAVAFMTKFKELKDWSASTTCPMNLSSLL